MHASLIVVVYTHSIQCMRRDALWKMFFQGDYQQQKPTVLPKVGEQRIARSFQTVLNASRPVTFELLFYDHLFSDDKKVIDRLFRFVFTCWTSSTTIYNIFMNYELCMFS